MRFRGSKPDLSRAEFLEELRRESALHFEPDVATAMLLEVEAHLDESIQSRLELGESREFAERQAVKSFHEPKRFVRSMGAVHEDAVNHDRILLLIGLGLIGWIGFGLEIETKSTAWFAWPLGILVLGLLLAVRSIQIGSVRKGTLAALLLATTVCIGGLMPLTWINSWSYGGMGYMPISMAREFVADPKIFEKMNSSQENSFVSYMPTQSEAEQVKATKAALAAPLLERYATNASETTQLFIFTFALVSLGHLAPVAIRRRFQQRSGRRARAA